MKFNKLEIIIDVIILINLTIVGICTLCGEKVTKLSFGVILIMLMAEWGVNLMDDIAKYKKGRKKDGELQENSGDNGDNA